MNNWMDALQNPIGQAIQKFMIGLLGARCNPHQKMIEQLSRSVYNTVEYEEFARLFAEVYEAGYMRAIEEHEKELKKLGIKVVLKKIEKAVEKSPLF